MRKRLKIVISCLLVIMLSFTLLSESAYAQSNSRINDLELDDQKSTVFNEYDYIIQTRKKEEKDCDAKDMMIRSRVIEEEYLRRSKLTVEELTEYYLYSQEAAILLKQYSGEDLEKVPWLARASASLSSFFNINVCTGTSATIQYSWEWTSKPLICLTDYIAVGWEGNYAGGLSNQMQLESTSYSMVNYYFHSGNQKYERPPIIDQVPFRGVTMNFKMEKWIGGFFYWANRGYMIINLKLANQSSGPRLNLLGTVVEYAHYTFSITSPSISFPAGLSISFSGLHEIVDHKVRYKYAS